MDIKDYIHLYIDSEALYRKWYCDTPPEQEPTWSKLTSKRFQLLNDLSIVKVEYALRRLSDMTEEQARELAKFQHKPKYHDQIEILYIQKDHLHYIDGTRWHGDGVSEYNEYFVYFNQLQSNQFHYLLKQGFDLFGLIDAGIAIDSKTINK